MVQRMLEGAGQKLGCKLDGKKALAGVDLLAAGDAVSPICSPFWLENGVPARQTAGSFFTASLRL
jgi:hypothetical protein